MWELLIQVDASSLSAGSHLEGRRWQVSNWLFFMFCALFFRHRNCFFDVKCWMSVELPSTNGKYQLLAFKYGKSGLIFAHRHIIFDIPLKFCSFITHLFYWIGCRCYEFIVSKWRWSVCISPNYISEENGGIFNLKI